VRAGVDAREVAAIFVGGVVGALARLGLVELFDVGPSSWPWPTFIANVVGCFALGYFTTRLQERLPLSAYRRPLLGTGLCGALTTFSTVQIELLRLLDAGRPGVAIAYAVASLIACFGALTVATKFVRRARFAT
jgi:CrcB protein